MRTLLLLILVHAVGGVVSDAQEVEYGPLERQAELARVRSEEYKVTNAAIDAFFDAKSRQSTDAADRSGRISGFTLTGGGLRHSPAGSELDAVSYGFSSVDALLPLADTGWGWYTLRLTHPWSSAQVLGDIKYVVWEIGGPNLRRYSDTGEHPFPILGDTPFVSRLFRHKAEQFQQRALVTPAEGRLAASRGERSRDLPELTDLFPLARGAVLDSANPGSHRAIAPTSDHPSPPVTSEPLLLVPECTGLEFLPSHGGALLTWTSTPGRPLRIEVSDDLAIWESLTGVIETSPGVFQATDVTAAATSSRFYRAVLP